MSERKQFPAIDIAKFFCAFLILFYHYFSEHGPIFFLLEEFLSLYAVAVALFMTISGYLLFAKLGNISDPVTRRKVVLGQVKRILTIYLLWSVFYLVYQVSSWDWAQVDILFVLQKIRGWVFNSTFYTIWFMPALAVGILFAAFLQKHIRWSLCCVIAGIFYLLGSLQMTYSFVVASSPAFSSFQTFSNTWLQGARGGIFFGMPLVILGGCVAKIKWRNKFVTFALASLSLLILVVEALLLRHFVGSCGLDLALMMLPTCFFGLLFLTSFSWQTTPLHKWMRSMSILIFMTQRIFLTVIPSYFSATITNVVFGNPYVGALLICGATILFSAWIIKLSKRYPFFRSLF